MALNSEIERVTQRIIDRSAARRASYMEGIQAQIDKGPKRGHLSCSGQAHAYAGAGPDQHALATKDAPNIGIVTTFNDMLGDSCFKASPPQKALFSIVYSFLHFGVKR